MENKHLIIGIIVLVLIVAGGLIFLSPKNLSPKTIEISTDKTEYSIGETIELTIVNNLGSSAYGHPCGLGNWPHAFRVMKKTETGWEDHWEWEMVECIPYENIEEFQNPISTGQTTIQIPTGSFEGFSEAGEYILELSVKANCANSSIDSCKRLKSNSIEFKIK